MRNNCFLAVIADAQVNLCIGNYGRQPKRVRTLSQGKQSDVGCDSGTIKLKLHAAVEIEPQRTNYRFTTRARYASLQKTASLQKALKTLIFISESTIDRIN